jgi:hypothetical protein
MPFAILICNCNSHMHLQLSRWVVLFLRGCLQFSYAFVILISGSRHNVVTYIGIVLMLRSKGGVHYNLQIV